MMSGKSATEVKLKCPSYHNILMNTCYQHSSLVTFIKITWLRQYLQSHYFLILHPSEASHEAQITFGGYFRLKLIQPVHSEGHQPWDFFGRNDAKAETPVLWPPHAKS